MPDIKVTVRNKIAVGDGTEIVCGNSDYTVVFDFDAEWEAFDAKTMRVRFTNNTYKDVVFNGTSCILPIVQNSVGVDIGVFAGALHTTSVATFDCVKSILSGGGSPDTSEPIIDPSIIEMQGDWNQNDTTAADYIKNRPGAYMGDETIYDGTPTTVLGDDGLCFAPLPRAFTLTAGNAYRVTFNGTAYVLTAQDKTAEFNAVILGEITINNKPDFTNYPFCIAQNRSAKGLFTETAGTYTLKVESLGTVVVPLDSRFMPLGYATEEFVTSAINAALYVDSETEVG